MFEDSLGFEGDDGNEDSDPIMPHLRAIDGINPFDRGFKDAYNAGVTTVVTGPGSANPVGGQFAAVKTYGICVDDMIIKTPVAMKFALGENPKCVYNEKDEAPVTRMGTIALIRELLIKSRDYMNQLDAYNENSEEHDKPEFDIKLDAMIPVLKKQIPVKIHAHRADDICSSIRLGITILPSASIILSASNALSSPTYCIFSSNNIQPFLYFSPVIVTISAFFISVFIVLSFYLLYAFNSEFIHIINRTCRGDCTVCRRFYNLSARICQDGYVPCN